MLPLKLIMAPIDFSPPSHDALRAATDLAETFGAELFLVHVVPTIPKLPSARTAFHEREYENELHKEAQQRLASLVEDVAARKVKARYEVGTANDVSMELLRIAEHNQVDLIVIATHGMTGWRKLAFGSVTDKVVRLAECPVLVLRDAATGKADESATQSVATAR